MRNEAAAWREGRRAGGGWYRGKNPLDPMVNSHYCVRRAYELEKNLGCCALSTVNNNLIYSIHIFTWTYKIQKLNNNHQKLKDEIQINQKKYEKIIDETADEISSFVKKANLENLS